MRAQWLLLAPLPLVWRSQERPTLGASTRSVLPNREPEATADACCVDRGLAGGQDSCAGEDLMQLLVATSAPRNSCSASSPSAPACSASTRKTRPTTGRRRSCCAPCQSFLAGVWFAIWPKYRNRASPHQSLSQPGPSSTPTIMVCTNNSASKRPPFNGHLSYGVEAHLDAASGASNTRVTYESRRGYDSERHARGDLTQPGKSGSEREIPAASRLAALSPTHGRRLACGGLRRIRAA
jgi:hypothetical protein